MRSDHSDGVYGATRFAQCRRAISTQRRQLPGLLPEHLGDNGGLLRVVRLISKGLLNAPRYGYAQFTAPQFDRFMRRHMHHE